MIMAAVPPSGGSGDRIKVDPIALPASGATTGAEAAAVAAGGAAGAAQGVGGLAGAAAQPDGVSLAINAVTSTWPAQDGTFLADLSRAVSAVASGDVASAAQLEAQDTENAAGIVAVAPGAATASV